MLRCRRGTPRTRSDDDVAHRPLDLGIQARARVVGGGGGAGGDDPREHERREVLQVAGPQDDAEVALGERGRGWRRPPACAGAARRARASSAAVARHPVGGDGDVHHDIRDAVLVDEVAEGAQLGDERGLERPERVAARSCPSRACGGAPRGRRALHPSRRAPGGSAGAAARPRFPRRRARSAERSSVEPRAAEQRPHPREVGVEGRAAHVQLDRRSRRRRCRRRRPAGRARAKCRRSRGVPVSCPRRRAAPRRPAGARGTPADPDSIASPVGDARVDGGDVRADAARRHAQGVGEGRGGRPVRVAERAATSSRSCRSLVTAVLSLRCGGPGLALLVNHARRGGGPRRRAARRRPPRAAAAFRPGGKRRGCPLPAFSQEWPQWEGDR